MKKILLTSSIFGIPALTFAGNLTQLEGSFKVGPAIILITILITFIMVGFFSQAKDTTDFFAAGRKISNVSSGMAIAANWMSAASFLGMAAMMYGTGYHGLSYVVGWTGGYVLLLILMAGQIRKYGKFTAPDFIGDRFYSQGLRATSAIFTIFISFAYMVGQFGGVGLMFKWILGIDYAWAVLIGASVVIFYTMISGMMGVTKNMVVQYTIIIIAFMIPTFMLTYKYDYFWLLPQFGYGSVVTDIVQGIPAPNIADGVSLLNAYGHHVSIVPSPEFAMPWDASTGKSAFQWIAICFSLMLGTAGLPHVLSRFYITPTIRDARLSCVWGLFFICILYWFSPIYSAFGKILSSNPEVGNLAKDAIVVYTAQLGDIPPLVVGFLAAGGVSAAFSTISGLLVASSGAFAHDLYAKILKPDCTPKKQLLMARIGTVVIGISVGIVAMLNLGMIAQLVAVAFSMAACTIFPLFLLGIWWSGANKSGAIAGMTTGIVISLFSLTYFITSKMGIVLPGTDFVEFWLNVWYFAWIGAPLSILVNIVVSKYTEPTPIEIKKFLIEKVHT